MKKRFDTTEGFRLSIPSDVVGNVEFRKNLHGWLVKDEGAQKVYLEMCLADPKIMFNSAFWTFNPRNAPGCRNMPFILRHKQELAVDRLVCAVNGGHNLLFDKSRDEGATEILCKTFAFYWLLVPESIFLIGSRKEELVDKGVEIHNGHLTGSHQCLFHKILYAIHHLPFWLQPKGFDKTHLHYQNLSNDSIIDGESTNESFGAAHRCTAVGVDEVARIEPSVAQSIIENISDVTECCIFNSTQWNWGEGHPYAKLLKSNKIEVITLGYEDNPEKNQGLYRSPELDVIEIKDIGYYRKKYPDYFNNIEAFQPFKLSEFEKELLTEPKAHDLTFVGDGGEGNFNCWRSVWFDKQEKERASKRYIAQNILRIPYGSGDMFFDPSVLKRLETYTVRPPDFKGDIKHKVIKGKVTNVSFRQQSKGHFEWWGKLVRGRPVQGHNYIVACDIARGTGASNSVAKVIDVNTHEECGIYVSPFIAVYDFAELAVALCNWVGGTSKRAYLIWDATGPGDTFDKRIRDLGYSFVYSKTDERAKSRKRTNKRGFYCMGGVSGAKNDMLMQLDAALVEGLKKERRYKSLIVHDKQTVNELKSYIFYEGRAGDVGLSEASIETSGAKYAHGDRVIASGLAVVAMTEQPKAAVKEERKVRRNTLGARIQTRKTEKSKAIENRRFLW